MNKLIAGVIIIVLNILLSQFLPWWNFVPIVIVVVCFMKLKASASWIVPALSLMILWFIQIVLLDHQTDFRSSGKIADLFDAPGVLAYLIPVLGVGLMAALSGAITYLLRTAFNKTTGLVDGEMHIDDYQETQSDLKDKGII